MIQLSFPTIKLGKYIKEIKTKVKNTDLNQVELTVYGVTNTNGVTITNNKASDDLGNYTVLSGNQFAYNPYRINVGSIGLSSRGTFGVVSPAYVVFETTEEISNEFLLYYLKSTLGINLIKWYGDRGGVRSALRFADLKKIDFPDINLEQQLLILKKVKQIDDKLLQFNENLSIERVSDLRRSILQQAIKGKLCEQDPNDEPASVLLEKIKAEKEKLIAEKKIKKQKELPPIIEGEKPFELPQGWEWCRLDDIGELSRGKSKHRPRNDIILYENGIYPMVQTGDVARAKEYIGTFTALYNELGLKQSRLWKKGTLCITIAANIADTGILNFNACFPDSVVGFIPYIDGMSVKYFKWYIDVSKNNLEKYAPSTAQKNINLEILNDLSIPLPPLAEQQRIVEKVDRLRALCDELEQELLSAKKYASQLMEAVLQEAFSSKDEMPKDNVIEFAPAPKPEKEVLLGAARGNMREDTWQRLANRARALANEEI